jgi:hypothetical protein
LKEAVMDDEPLDAERVVLLANCLLDVFRTLRVTEQEAICAMATLTKAIVDKLEIAEEEQPTWRH